MAVNPIQYVKNVGKSMGYIAIDKFKNNNPTIAAMIDTNKDTVKDIYQTVKEWKSEDNPSLKDKALNSEYPRIGINFVKNTLSDLKTGKFYNEEREEEIDNRMAKGMGFDLDFDLDFDDEMNLDFDDNDFNMEDGFNDIELTMDHTGGKIANAISEVTVRSADYVVDSQKFMTSKLLEHQERSLHEIMKGFSTINTSLANIDKLGETITTHSQNSSVFYTKSNEYQDKVLASLDRIEKAITPKKKERSSDNTIRVSDIIGINGEIDIGKFIENTKKNIKEELSLITDIADMTKGEDGEGVNAIEAMTASPIALMLSSAMDSIIPRSYKKARDKLNNNLKGLAGTAIMKINERANNWGGGGVLDKVFEMMGINNTYNPTYNVSNYNKGKVDFDGITRKAIVEVIPVYLSKILAAMTGQIESRFNYKTGKFIKTTGIEKSKWRIIDNASKSAGNELKEEFEKHTNGMANQKELLDNLNNFFRKSVENGEVFDYENATESDLRRFGLDRDTGEVFVNFLKSLRNNGKIGTLLNYNREVLSAREDITDRFRRLTEEGDDIIGHAYNNSTGRNSVFGDNTVGSIFNLKNQFDDKHNNVFFYLQGILQHVRHLSENIFNIGNSNSSNEENNTNQTNNIPLGNNRQRRRIRRNRIHSRLSDDAAAAHDNLFNGNYSPIRDIEDNTPIIQTRSTPRGPEGGFSTEDDYIEYHGILKDDYSIEANSNGLKKYNFKANRSGGFKLRNYEEYLQMSPEKRQEYLSLVQEAKEDYREYKEHKDDKLIPFLPSSLQPKEDSTTAKFVNGINELFKKPINAFSNFVDKSTNKLVDFLYGNTHHDGMSDEEIEDEETARANGFMSYIMYKTKKSFSHFTDWMDEHILNPLADKLDIHSTDDLLVKLFGIFGLDYFNIKEESRRFFNEIKEEFFGVKDEEGVYHNGTISKIINGVKSNLKGAKDWAKSAYSDTFGKAYKSYKDKTSDNQAANGAREVSKTGLVAVSKGEMIIPSESNPYYHGITNKASQIKAEKDAINKFYGNYATGTASVGEGNTTPMSDKATKKVEETIAKLYGKGMTFEEFKARFKEENPDMVDSIDSMNPSQIDSMLREILAKKNADKNQEKRESEGRKYTWKEFKNNIKDKYNGDKDPSFLKQSIDTLFEGIKSFKDAIIGTDEEIKDGMKSTKDRIKEVTTNALDEIRTPKGAADAITGALFGTGVSILSGGLVSPVLGASIGSAIGLTSKSEVIMKGLFGDIGEDGKREGALFSKEVSNFLANKLPKITKFGFVGSTVSLLPFIPGGPISGLLIGSALGFASESETIKDKLFGPKDSTGERIGGTFSKELQDKIKKAAPNMGAGIIAGMAIAPGGLLSKILIGSALGYASSTEGFQDAIFGKKDSEGNRQGGLVGYLKNDIIKPMAEGTYNIFHHIVGDIKDLFAGIKQHFIKAAREIIWVPLKKKLEHWIFKPITAIGKGVLNVSKFLFKKPSQLVHAIGEHYKKKDIKKGRADNMTAAERLQYREDHMKLALHDRTRTLDEHLSRMDLDQLNAMEELAMMANDPSKQLRLQANQNWANIDKELGSYDPLKPRDIRKIHAAIRSKDMDRVEHILNKRNLGEEANARIMGILRENADKINDIDEKRRNIDNVTANAISEFKDKYGVDISGAMMNSRVIDLIRNEKKHLPESGSLDNPDNTTGVKNPELVDTTNKQVVDDVHSILEYIKIMNGYDPNKDYTAEQLERISQAEDSVSNFSGDKKAYKRGNRLNEQLEELSNSISRLSDIIDNEPNLSTRLDSINTANIDSITGKDKAEPSLSDRLNSINTVNIDNLIGEVNGSEPNAAKGGIVTKSGLVALSRGEVIVEPTDNNISDIITNDIRKVSDNISSAAINAANAVNSRNNKATNNIEYTTTITGESIKQLRNNEGELVPDLSDNKTREARKHMSEYLDAQIQTPKLLMGISGGIGSLASKLFSTDKEAKGLGGIFAKLFGADGLLGGFLSGKGGVFGTIFKFFTGGAFAALLKGVLGSFLSYEALKGLLGLGWNKDDKSNGSSSTVVDNIAETGLETITGGSNNPNNSNHSYFGRTDNNYIEDENGNKKTISVDKNGKVQRDKNGNLLDEYGNTIEGTSGTYVNSKVSGKSVSTRLKENVLRGAIKGKKSLIVRQASKLSNKAISAGKKAANSKLATAILTKAKSSLTKIFSKLPSKFSSKTTQVVEKFMAKFSESIVGKSSQALTKISNRVSKFVPVLNVVTAIMDAETGWENAASTLGIVDEPSVGEKAFAALLRLVKNNASLITAFIPDNAIVDFCINQIAPIFDIDVSDLKNRRAQAEQIVSQYNQKNGTEYNIEDYNKHVLDRWTSTERIGNAVKSAKNNLPAIANKIKNGKLGEATGDVLEGGYNLGIDLISNSSVTDLTLTGMKKLGLAKEDTTTQDVASAIKDTPKTFIDQTKSLIGMTKVGKKLGIKGSIQDHQDTMSKLTKKQQEIKNSRFKEGKMLLDGSETFDEYFNRLRSNNKTIPDDYLDTFIEYMKKNNRDPKDIPSDVLSNKGKSKISSIVNDTTNKSYKSLAIKDNIDLFGSKYNSFNKSSIKTKKNTTSADKASKSNTEKYNSKLEELKTAIKKGDTKKLNSLKLELDPNDPSAATTETLFTNIKNVSTPTALLTDSGNMLSSLSNKMEKDMSSLTASTSNTDKQISNLLKKSSSTVKDLKKIKTNKKSKNNIYNSLANYNSGLSKLLAMPLLMMNNSLNTADGNTTKYIKDNSNTSKSTKKGAGSKLVDFVSQNSSDIKDMKYGSSTVGEEGCGPAVAAMAINQAKAKSNKVVNIQDTIAYARRNGYETTGGTTADYFQDIFKSNGINSDYIDTKSDGIDKIESNLQSNIPTVLLGQDSSNDSKDNSPFGKGSHYILAKGYDRNGNILVDDPEQNKTTSYSPDILNKVSTAISTSKLASGTKRNKASNKAYKATIYKFPNRIGGGLRGGSLEEQAFNFFIDNGFSAAAAAGATGNMMEESGWDHIDIKSVESNGEGVGIVQWSFGRKTQFLQYCKDIGKPFPQYTEFEVQLQYVLKELYGDGVSCQWAFDSSYKGTELDKYNCTLSEFITVKDPSLAAGMFSCNFERPSRTQMHLDQRQRNAVDIYNQFSGNDPVAYDGTDYSTSGTSDSESTEAMGLVSTIGNSLTSDINKAFAQTLPEEAAKLFGIDTSTSSNGKNITSDDATNNALGADIITDARKYIGTKYVFGGEDLQNGIDCSSFTQQVMSHNGINIPRTAAQQRDSISNVIDRNNAKAGDMVFFQGTYKDGISHVGIMTDNNNFIHAGSKGVAINSLSEDYYNNHFDSIRRPTELGAGSNINSKFGVDGLDLDFSKDSSLDYSSRYQKDINDYNKKIKKVNLFDNKSNDNIGAGSNSKKTDKMDTLISAVRSIIILMNTEISNTDKLNTLSILLSDYIKAKESNTKTTTSSSNSKKSTTKKKGKGTSNSEISEIASSLDTDLDDTTKALISYLDDLASGM